MHSFYVSARLFKMQAHRERAMHTALALLRKRFGRTVVPEEVARLVPKLII